MTPRLKEIAARAEAATEGPWDAEECLSYHRNPDGPDAYAVGPSKFECTEYLPNGYGLEPPQATADADFIAHARSDIPYLLSEIARRDEQLRAAREALEKIDMQPDEIGLSADDATEEHQDCWHTAHNALAEMQRILGAPEIKRKDCNDN